MKLSARGLARVTGLLMLLSLVLGAPSIASAATSTAGSLLDARLGGTNTSFQTSFGTPVPDKSSDTIEVYSVSGFGLVAAAFLNSNAYEITIAADRLSHKPLTEPDDADWTVSNAARFADAVVPTDSTYGKPVMTKDKIEIVGHSKALEKAFTKKDLTSLQVAGKPGDFDVIYHLDTNGDVYSVDVSMGNGTPLPAPTTPSSKSNSTSSNSTKSNSTSSGNAVANGQVAHCRDFGTQADAQAYFDAHGGDSNPAVSGMDGDKDNKPCENLP